MGQSRQRTDLEQRSTFTRLHCAESRKTILFTLTTVITCNLKTFWYLTISSTFPRWLSPYYDRLEVAVGGSNRTTFRTQVSFNVVNWSTITEINTYMDMIIWWKCNSHFPKAVNLFPSQIIVLWFPQTSIICSNTTTVGISHTFQFWLLTRELPGIPAVSYAINDISGECNSI